MSPCPKYLLHLVETDGAIVSSSQSETPAQPGLDRRKRDVDQTGPTRPIATMPAITVVVDTLACACTIMKPTPVEATISSAPTSDCQPRPAATRSPATIEGIEAGSRTSVDDPAMAGSEHARGLDAGAARRSARRDRR